MTAMQLDLLARPSGVTTLPGSKVITTAGGAWQARWIGDRYGWVFYRLTTFDGWEPWEPDLPFGEAHLYDRDAAERVILAAAERHGDTALAL